MTKCKYLTIVPQEVGIPLYKCAINNIDNPECFGNIREKLLNDNVMPNGECPFYYRSLDISECPCFEQ